MVTDRISTCGLLVVVSHIYPDYSLYFILLIILDVASHWFHVMRFFNEVLNFYPDNSICCFSVSAHHKSKEALEHRNPILKWYYSVYVLFGYCCVGTELFYVLLYVIHHVENPLLSQV